MVLAEAVQATTTTVKKRKLSLNMMYAREMKKVCGIWEISFGMEMRLARIGR